MSPKMVSFILVTFSLGFTAFAFSQVPVSEPSPEPAAAVTTPSHPGSYRHYAARARNGSTQKSVVAQPPPSMPDGGTNIWDPNGTGNYGLDNGLDGGATGAGTTGDKSNIPHR